MVYDELTTDEGALPVKYKERSGECVSRVMPKEDGGRKSRVSLMLNALFSALPGTTRRVKTRLVVLIDSSYPC